MKFCLAHFTLHEIDAVNNEYCFAQWWADCYLRICCLDVLDMSCKKDGHARDLCCVWLLMLLSDYYQVGLLDVGDQKKWIKLFRHKSSFNSVAC